MNVHLINLIFRHGFDIMFYGLLDAEGQRRHIVTVIHNDADIGDDALFFKQKLYALVFCVQKADALHF